ncbi:uncharacterized protein LOC123533364 [Mercenaria mercenaria]|uniref:uncharacterized protein LOC123533364 n=1 Tax=Mercenaria mercenaria TaxID=6596 RepID=UPI00234F3C48|nr:uncharacterized protein LOC123533364 [Mercenaria mercenaria]
MKQVSQRNILRTTLHNMRTALWWICVIIFVSSCLSSAESVIGMDIKTATFQMLHEHPKLKKCTETILQKHEYVGCRVSMQTGQCEGLDHNWGLHPTLEQGYAYAKKMYVQQNFYPPLEIKEENNPISRIPVVLNAGARIDIHISLEKHPDPKSDPIPELLVLKLMRVNAKVRSPSLAESRNLVLRFLGGTKLELDEVSGKIWSEETEKLRSLEIIKISLLVQADSAAVLVGDEVIGMMKLVNHPRNMSWLDLKKCVWCPHQYVATFIHRVEFTGK